jgi:hypothetical protein
MMVANCLGDSLLLWLAFNGLFLWSPIYSAKKDLIDNTCAAICNKLTEVKNKVDAIIPKYKD